MYVEDLNAPLLAALARPDLRIVGCGRQPRFDLRLAEPFRVGPGARITLGPAAVGPGRICAFHLRHAFELSALRDAGVAPALASLAAARVAARFFRLDAPGEADPEDWLAAMGGEACADAAHLGAIWQRLRSRQEEDAAGATLDPDAIARLASSWAVLGPAELLLAEGGDARLGLGAASQLNHYGCSHRPRPWAVTYASSTASSLSERGFGGADAARRRIVAAALAGAPDPAAGEIERVRAAIARHYGLPAGTAIVLAASGTDCELVSLAVAARAPGAGALVNILTAPDETGSGVPLASVGRHFANDTAGGLAVAKGAPIAGMPAAVTRADLAIRRSDGTLIPGPEIDAACARMIDGVVAGEGRALLHFLDVSKTGLLAPSIACVAAVARRHRGQVDVVVDACQARLTAARVRSYVEVGWMVMITGSKFFTGPPFCGAVLIPPAMRARLDAAPLPAGLADYARRTDWPAEIAAADVLPAGSNHGLALRWSAAIAEMEAFAAVPALRKRTILQLFTEAVAVAIDTNPDVKRVVAPPLVRPVLGDVLQGWDDVQTIMPFLVLSRDRRPLDLEQARRIYQWLNADVSACLPAGLGATDRFLAALRCHIGQPAPVADGAGGIAGALRISAGARLVSGEPSHDGIDGEARLAREIRDARACLEKLSLLLRHFPALDQADPQPSFGAPLEP